MASNTKLSDAAANAEANALSSLMDNGYFRIYDGAQPSDANTAISSQNKLAELRFGAPAYGAAVAGVITANALAKDPAAAATGTASWFRIFQSDGSTVVFDGSVGLSNCNLNISSVAIQQNAEVSITRFIHTVTE